MAEKNASSPSDLQFDERLLKQQQQRHRHGSREFVGCVEIGTGRQQRVDHVKVALRGRHGQQRISVRFAALARIEKATTPSALVGKALVDVGVGGVDENSRNLDQVSIDGEKERRTGFIVAMSGARRKTGDPRRDAHSVDSCESRRTLHRAPSSINSFSAWIFLSLTAAKSGEQLAEQCHARSATHARRRDHELKPRIQVGAQRHQPSHIVEAVGISDVAEKRRSAAVRLA